MSKFPFPPQEIEPLSVEQRAIDFIRRYSASKDINVEVVARHCGVSRRVLERRFRASLDRTPLEEIVRRRVAIAKWLLCNPDMPVTEVAFAVGFADVKSLRAHFSRHEGVSPGDWRRLHQLPGN